MFHNDTDLEYKNFFLNTASGTYTTEIHEPLVQDCLELIKARIATMNENDARYIEVPKQMDVRINGERVLEIVWD